MRTRVVILGAGFAGLELSSRLSAELAGQVVFTPPSIEAADDKRRYAASRRDRWFGPGPGAGRPDSQLTI
jgi:hypothetical protein